MSNGPRTGLERGPRVGSGPIEKPKNQKDTLLRIWHYLQKQRLGVILAIFTVVGVTVLKLIGPWLIGIIVDDYIAKFDIEGTIMMALWLGASYLATFGVTYIQTVVMIFVAQRTIQRIRQELFNKFQRLPLRFFDQRQQGDLMSRVTNDIDSLNMALTQSITQILSAILTIVGTAAAMVLLDWRLAIVTVTIIPLIVFASKQIIKRSSVNYKARQRDLGQLNGYIEETISGIEIVTLFGKEAQTAQLFEEKNERLRKSALRAETISGFMGPINNAMNNLGLGLVIGVGAILSVKGYTSVGVIAAFVTYTRQFFQPINQLSNLLNTFQSAIAGAERVFEVLDEKDETVDESGTIKATHFNGHVVFEDVSFEYEQGKPILKGISFEAKQGEIIALVGPTGSGKTTVINLLTRFYPIDQGMITVDGVPIEQYEMASLRNHIGVVLQDTYLFSGTIRENIRFGKLDATDEEVEKAAKIAYAHKFIRHLPEQYETAITSGGTNLSQGQRQLIAIARAILEDPDILILDEATSNVDTRTEVHIQKGLQNLMHGRTSFVIAHRLKTIEQADQILVLGQGEILEQGNHDSLMMQQGIYYEMQTKLQGA
ncbi:ABC transporter ATP-binding protein [Ferdinandcohnia quinoae]|uniref:ABC transporter ATP-binding protein/permease n=1 Tax=Fredinandcohnia quinoae TaxID=2918902 RepID=A0AAW5E6B6_9BACI|nr:ABC transporter ATP-binding protein/permease [Fredinandcohnia sp. SECRCQ15]